MFLSVLEICFCTDQNKRHVCFICLRCGCPAALGSVPVSPSCMIPEIAVSPIMLVIQVSMGVSCVAFCPPPVADISCLYDVTLFLAAILMSNHFFHPFILTQNIWHNGPVQWVQFEYNCSVWQCYQNHRSLCEFKWAVFERWCAGYLAIWELGYCIVRHKTYSWKRTIGYLSKPSSLIGLSEVSRGHQITFLAVWSKE